MIHERQTMMIFALKFNSKYWFLIPNGNTKITSLKHSDQVNIFNLTQILQTSIIFYDQLKREISITSYKPALCVLKTFSILSSASMHQMIQIKRLQR